ncbi:MTH938/NDUFAF3 family protein [sulfur-oxidizing endosymbiont of Gigantopelta aegis]|uniref:MTH938/NDUFAF3 family protein n=1 Tax=sulfur-oxidizing endosymbiont of Gigantopelta aegis TaxID=2794934 RepID=UPI0018DE3735|nr:MTH938/NDUFAF3 family protein [sulfur-oxidizing endosymbiont of Gigantopelta aegis]
MLQLENIENAYSFHSYDDHSAKLVKPGANIHSNNAADAILEINISTLIYKDKVYNELMGSEMFPASFADFDEQCVEKLSQYDADIYLIGTGNTSRFPDKAILQFIASKALSIDFMDIGAASRTFNILTSEYRKVAALIFFN